MLASAEQATLLDRIIEEEERRFLEMSPRAAEYAERASRSLPGGVTSSWQISRPQPIWIEQGRGSKVRDVDGNEFIDYHGGYGAMLAGHAHPAIVAAVKDRVEKGTHFAQPTHDAVVVSEELADRYGLPLWRYGNSGTEATMDAIHLMRAVTGRDLIIKFEGAYHGHHDAAMVSVWNEEDLGPERRPKSVAAGSGIPQAMVDLTLIATFNDIGLVETLFEEHPGEIAGVIVEPILQNCGILLPQPGFIQSLREVTMRHDALLTFDEVKTGLTAGRGGATRLLGVQSDIVCLAKSLGGGLPISAIGGTDEVMGAISDGTYEQVGTFNGNPLSLAAARAMLTEVMVPDTYAHLETLQTRMRDGAESVIRRHALDAHVATAGAKGSVIYSPQPMRTYRDFLEIDGRYAMAAWLYQFNRGVFLPPWAKGEQWLISVQHDAGDIDRYLETLDEFAGLISG
ncbi:MAG TPA: aspartate aminotransferase family protein [Acidimicrobiia bacterium]|jgi:glutamate-1-semialdehyde 2,1-aminomutase|nr:aspartate aminotransferase family protein [Acidimicrobiia bacterium]